MDDQILLGVFADALNELRGLFQRLVGLIVDARFLRNWPAVPLPSSRSLEDAVEAGYQVVHLLREDGILASLPSCAFAGVDLGLSWLALATVVFRLLYSVSSLRNLPALPLPSLKIRGDLVYLVDGRIERV
jgi:hypothetical protein